MIVYRLTRTPSYTPQTQFAYLRLPAGYADEPARLTLVGDADLVYSLRHDGVEWLGGEHGVCTPWQLSDGLRGFRPYAPYPVEGAEVLWNPRPGGEVPSREPIARALAFVLQYLESASGRGMHAMSDGLRAAQRAWRERPTPAAELVARVRDLAPDTDPSVVEWLVSELAAPDARALAKALVERVARAAGVPAWPFGFPAESPASHPYVPEPPLPEREIYVAPGVVWTAPRAIFLAVLDQLADRAAPSLLRRSIDTARRFDAVVAATGTEAREQLHGAAYGAYVGLVRTWRAGAPDDHDALVEHTGRLVRTLEAAAPASPVDDWSVRRLQAFGASIDARFPHELKETLMPMIAADPARAEAALRRLRDADVGEDASAIMGAAFLPGGRDEVFMLECATHPREEVRFQLFTLLARNQRLPAPGSLAATLTDANTLTLLCAGLADPAPRVRARAVAYVYGLGRVGAVRSELLATLRAEADRQARAYELLALGVLDDAESLSLLTRALESAATVEDVNAALWALARRPDGVARVLAALDDARADVRHEATGALVQVGAPLAAEQLSWLAAPERPADTRAALEAYRRRQVRS